jgi:hypothetical protein
MPHVSEFQKDEHRCGALLRVSRKKTRQPQAFLTYNLVGRKDSALIHICIPHVSEFQKDEHRFMPDRSDKGRGQEVQGAGGGGTRVTEWHGVRRGKGALAVQRGTQ